MKSLSEIRLPLKLVKESIGSTSNLNLLRTFAFIKLHGHRCKISNLSGFGSSRTIRRHINKMIAKGWIRTDGHFLFPNSWRRLELSKKGGIYLTEINHKKEWFYGLCFAKSLKQIMRKGATRSKGEFSTLPSHYYVKSLNTSLRTFYRLKQVAIKYKFITSKQEFKPVGKAKDIGMLRKVGFPAFVRGNFSVIPDKAKIKFKI